MALLSSRCFLTVRGPASSQRARSTFQRHATTRPSSHCAPSLPADAVFHERPRKQNAGQKVWRAFFALAQVCSEPLLDSYCKVHRSSNSTSLFGVGTRSVSRHTLVRQVWVAKQSPDRNDSDSRHRLFIIGDAFGAACAQLRPGVLVQSAVWGVVAELGMLSP